METERINKLTGRLGKFMQDRTKQWLLYGMTEMQPLLSKSPSSDCCKSGQEGEKKLAA